jgi:hypothetical protein
MVAVIMGALAMAFAVAGLFFLRFWRDTKDRLFGFFALAFFVLAGGRLTVALYYPHAHGDYVYWVRFLAFALILLAILDKNRSSKAAAKQETKPRPRSTSGSITSV